MQIQPASAYTALSQLNFPPRRNQTPSAASQADPAANFAARVSISESARQLLAAQSGASNTTAVFDTDKGARELDIDAYFTPPGSQGVDLDSLPILSASPQNIETLRRHISATLPGFLAKHDIPFPPASITYDNEGKMQLPADYPYATEFAQALKDAPALDREMHAVNALTSHLVDMQKVMPFNEEYAAASSQAAADAVVAKYSHLFSGNRHYDVIALNFTAKGELSLTHDGKPLSQA